MMIVYNQPADAEWKAVETVTLSKEEAILRQKKAARDKSFAYKSDQQALEDFMTIHWAWEETSTKG